jgi:hypothetical protein
LSSTYEDLKDHRKEVADGLRKLGHQVIGMEDYVAEGSRPLAKCVRDVAESDVYVGVFAWRYGYVPEEPDNPDKLSITELELETARRELGVERCLIFIVNDKAAWPPLMMDSVAGLNDQGRRIVALKTRLATDFTISKFQDTQELAKLVNTAVANLPPPPERHVRQIVYDALLAYADPADQAVTQAFTQALSEAGIRCRLVPRALFARSTMDFRDLEREVVQCHAALLLLTPALLGQVKALPDKGQRVVETLSARTGAVIGLLKGVSAADLPAEWNLTASVELPEPVEPAAAPVATTVRAHCPTLGRSTVGLPYMVLSMTAAEAAELFNGTDPGSSEQRFTELAAGLKRDGDPVTHYGPHRRDWKPFGLSTAETIAAEIARRLNGGDGALGQRFIKLQYYPFTPWLTQDEDLSGVYRDLLATGCIALVDQVSLFHSKVVYAISAFLGQSPQVAVVAVSPPENLTREELRLVEQQARDRLTGVFSRFDSELDPACEFGIAEERRLRRWLRASLPATVNNLAELRPDPGRRDRFRRLVAPDRRLETAKLLWPDRVP